MSNYLNCIGTFQAEDEEVVYGLTHPIETYGPGTIQVRFYGLKLWCSNDIFVSSSNNLSGKFLQFSWGKFVNNFHIENLFGFSMTRYVKVILNKGSCVWSWILYKVPAMWFH